MIGCNNYTSSIWNLSTKILLEPPVPLEGIELDNPHHKHMILREILLPYVAISPRLTENVIMTNSSDIDSITDEDDEVLPNNKHLKHNSQLSPLPYRHTKFKESIDSSPSFVDECNYESPSMMILWLLTCNWNPINMLYGCFHPLILNQQNAIKSMKSLSAIYLLVESTWVQPLRSQVFLSFNWLSCIHPGKSHLPLDPGGATQMQRIPIASDTLFILILLFVPLKHFTTLLKSLTFTMYFIHAGTSRWHQHCDTCQDMLGSSPSVLTASRVS